MTTTIRTPAAPAPSTIHEGAGALSAAHATPLQATPLRDTRLRIGTIELASPVVLAPMAGVTNVAFRTLCRELELARTGTVSVSYTHLTLPTIYSV